MKESHKQAGASPHLSRNQAIFLAALGVSVAIDNAARAQSYTWTAAQDNNWQQYNNWSPAPNIYPQYYPYGVTTLFNGTGAAQTSVDLGGALIGGGGNQQIVFDSPLAPSYTIGDGGFNGTYSTPLYVVNPNVVNNQTVNASIQFYDQSEYYGSNSLTLTNDSLASTLSLGGTFTGAVNTYTSGSRPGGQTTVDTFNLSGNGNYNITGSFEDVPVSAASSMDHVAAIAVVGGGKVVLSGPLGSNPFSGGVTVNNGGTLVLDYGTNATVVPASTSLSLTDGSTLDVRGKTGTSNVTSQTIGNPFFGYATTANIVVDNNGGGGTTLTLGNVWSGGGYYHDYLINFDLSSGGAARVATGGFDASSQYQVQNGIIVDQAYPGTAATTVKGVDGNTYFGTLDGSGNIVPQTNLTLFANDAASGNTSYSTNYLINGNLNTTGYNVAGSIRIAPTAQDQVWDVGGNYFPNVNDQAVIFDGGYNYTIQNYSKFAGPVNFFVAGTGVLTLTGVDSGTSSSNTLAKTGPGTLVLAADQSASGANVNILGGVLRLGNASYLPGGNLTVQNGIIELGGASTFSRSLGSSSGQFQVANGGSAGFSAIGGNAVVNLGGSGATIAFGSPGFIGSINSKLLFSTPQSDSTVDFQNGLDLAGVPQTIQVARGTATIDAKISGVISDGSLIKTGPGVLQLTAANSYTGGTVVNQGSLVVSSASALGTGPVVLTSASLTFNAAAINGALLPQSQLSPLAVTGFNHDVIRGVNAPASGVTIVGLGASNDTLYEQGATLGPDYYNEQAPAGSGLPVNTPAGRTFVSGTNPSTTFQLQDYTQNNGLTALTPTTLTLTIPASFTKLAFLDASPNNTNTYDAVLNFTDGSSTTISSISVPDWGTKGAAALSADGRATVGGNFDQGNAPYYATNLFEYDYTLSPTDQQKTVASITFQNGSQQYYSNPPGQTAEILAVSGGTPSALAGSQTTIYANDITTTGTSTIDLSTALTRVSYVQALTVTGSLTITGAHNALSVAALSLSGTNGAWISKVDLGANDLVVRSGNLAQVANQVAQGYNNATWNAAGGIVSNAAASDTSHLTALGVIQNSVDGTPTGAVLHSTFDGTPALPSDVIVKYTYYGDTTLKGYVDGSDYSRIDNGYLSQLSGWVNGDFNYDGVVNGSDYTLIDNAYNSQGASLTAEVAAPTAQVSSPDGSSAVPEPGTVGLIVMGAAGALGRRRRRFH